MTTYAYSVAMATLQMRDTSAICGDADYYVMGEMVTFVMQRANNNNSFRLCTVVLMRRLLALHLTAVLTYSILLYSILLVML